MNAHIITTRTVSAATIARTAVLALALINQILSAAGKPVLPIESAHLDARAAHRERPSRAAHLHRLHHRVCAGQLVVQQQLHAGRTGRR